MKKGVSGPTLMLVIGLILALIIIFGYSGFFGEQIAKAKRLVGKIDRSVASQACKQQGESLELRLGVQIIPVERDADQDGYPNSCDFCEGADDGDDVDDDGLPAACDDNPDTPVRPNVSFKEICEQKNGEWREELQNCRLSVG